MEGGRLPVRKRRRESLTRFLEKIRLGVRRTSATPGGGASAVVDEEATQSSTAPDHLAQRSAHSITAPVAFSDHPPNATNGNAPISSDNSHADVTARNLPLIPDNSGAIEPGDPNDPIPPFNATLDRLKSARARVLFERYGIQYEEGKKKRPDGRSYVDRSIRIRLHWECHQCRSAFDGNRVCKKCSHLRCNQCPRNPTKRVREILGDTLAMKEIEDKAANASTDTDAVLLPVAIGADASAPLLQDLPADKSASEASPVQKASEDILIADPHATDPELDLMAIGYTNRRKAGLGPQLHPRPKGDRVRCTCHECGANFTTSHTRKCMECGHSRCNACPMVTEPTDLVTQLASGNSDPPLLRVHRKPRQRVRWCCEHCHTTFLGSRSCHNCGHERCSSCIRSPLKKPSLTGAVPTPVQPTVTLIA